MINPISYFIEKPKVANLIVIFVVISGIFALFLTNREGYPSVDFGQITVSTIYEGASPKDVELKVTNKIEEKLKGINGIKKIMSWSMENYSEINIVLEDRANTEKVYKDVKNNVDQVISFPAGVKKPVITLIDLSVIPIMEIALTGNAPYLTKREFALALEKKLNKNSNVGNILKAGYLDREVKIEVNMDKLELNYVSLGEVINAIRNQNFRMSAGDVISDNEKKLVVLSEFEDIKDVGDVIIRSGFEGKRVVVNDVAVIKDGFKKPEQIINYNKDHAIRLIVYKKSGADIIKTTNSIKKIVKDFEKILPPSLKLNIIVDYSIETKNLLDLVINNAWMGFFLVILILLLLLNYKLAFWVGMGIPTSILFSLMLFPVFGVTINFITLTGIILVLGMLVDDAIVIGENIFRYREQGYEPKEAALKGTREVMWPVITSVTTTIIVFLPMFLMTGILGKFMRELPIVVGLLLISSLLESIFILPSHITHIKKINNSENIVSRIFKKIEIFYEKVIRYTLKHNIKTILIFVGLLILSIILLVSPLMKFILFPSDDGLYGYIELETEKGTSIEKTAKEIKKIEEILMTFSKIEIKGFLTTVGQKTPDIVSLDATISSGFYGNIIIYLTPMKDRKRTLTQIMNEVREKVKDVKGFTRILVDIVSDGPPVGKPVNITFISNNDTLRLKYSNKLKEFLKSQPGVTNIIDNEGEGKKQVQIRFNYDLLSRLNINPLAASEVIRAAFEGEIATSLKWDGEDVDFRVLLDESSRKNISTLKNTNNLETLNVQNMQGKLIPLGKFISVEEVDEKVMINHYSGDRSITISADLDTKVNTSAKVNKSIVNRFKNDIDKQPNIDMLFGGEEQETQESMSSLIVTFVIALIGIYFILVFLFNSFSQPLLVMIAIPFGFAGVVFAFFAHGLPFSFMAFIGMVGLTGVVVNDSLVMISFLNRKIKEKGLSIDIISQTAKTRLRPIVLTSATTAAGLFPTAYGFGGDNAFIVPMIMAIAWGLVFATFITLILLPSIYYGLYKIAHHNCIDIKKEKN